LVPLWHGTSYYDIEPTIQADNMIIEKGELIVKCMPELPDGCEIDEDKFDDYINEHEKDNDWIIPVKATATCCEEDGGHSDWWNMNVHVDKDCNIKKIYDKKDKNETSIIIGDAPEHTEIGKRLKIILKILKLNKKSMKIYFNCKSNLDDVFKYAYIHNININAFEEIMTDNIKKLINFKTTVIGFKDIEIKEIEQNKIYYINDLFLDSDVKDNSLGVISYSLLYSICNDFERFKVFIKKLSLITMFSSRCINFNVFEPEAEMFKYKANQIMTKIRSSR
jgi:hypothetical protein